MESSTPAFDNPLTLPIRRGQPLVPSTEEDESLMPDDLGDAVEQAPEHLELEPPVDPAQCPRCKGRLVNPQELGWCPKCGYCRSLEKDKATARLVTETQPGRSALHRFGEIGELIGKIPDWGWATAAGVCVIVAAASLANRFLPEHDSLARAVISLIGVIFSIVVILLVNLWSLFRLGATDEHVGPKDVFFCVAIWRKICMNLPDSRRLFWTIAWCLTACASAIFIVGGFDYWWEMYKPKRIAKSELLAAAGALGQGADDAKSLIESVEDMARQQDLTKQLGLGPKKNEEGRVTTQCVIVGYTLNGDNKLSGIVVGALLIDRVRFAGIVRKGFTPEQSQEILDTLKPLTQPKSYIPGLTMTAIWVKPEVFCEIEHRDFDRDQHFISPEYKGLLSTNK
jgi:hypothetical protein